MLLEPELDEAIRSVSHLDLARAGMMTRKGTNLSNRKERTGFLPPSSLRLGFVGQPFFYHAPISRALAMPVQLRSYKLQLCDNHENCVPQATSSPSANSPPSLSLKWKNC